GSRLLSTRFADEIEELASGTAWGAMDITEPDAGSDMGAMRTVAEEGPDGWKVTGQKIFITSGHAKHHAVVARPEPGEGFASCSFFLVRASADLPEGSRRRIVSLDGVEEKRGYHGSVPAGVSFERARAALGARGGGGFKYMLPLRNTARLAVGF